MGAKDADTQQVADLTAMMEKNLRRLRVLQTQSGTAAAELRAAAERLVVYEEQWLSAKAKTEDAQKRRQSIDIEVARAAAKRDQIQREQLDTLRTIADLEGNQQRTTQQIDGVRRLLQDLTQRRDTTQADLVISRQELAGAEQELVGIESSLQDLQKQIDLSQSAIEEHRRLLTRRRE